MEKLGSDGQKEKNHSEMDLYCIERCKFDRKDKKNGKQLDMIKCSMCAKWFHNDCVGLKKDAHPAVWPCPNCCDVFHSINTIRQHIEQNAALIESFQKSNETLRDCLDQAHREIECKQRECNTLRENTLQLEARLSKLENDHKCVTQEQSALCSQSLKTMAHDLKDLAFIKNQMQHIVKCVEKMNAMAGLDEDGESDDEEAEDATPQGTLLIGDSIIRSVQSTTDDLKVNSISGAKLSDVRKTLAKLNPRKEKYSEMYIVCGTNDLATKKDAEKIAQECEVIMNRAKEMADQVHFSSILPRGDDKVDPSKIDKLNQLLTPIANKLEVSFINHDLNFKYQNGSTDETLLLEADKLHLSAQGTEKLLGNLKLSNKAQANFGKGSVNRWEKSKAQSCDKKDLPAQWNDPLPMPAAPPCPPLPDPQRKFEDKPQPIKFRGPRSSFSNFYAAPLKMWGMTFTSCEQAYNFRKALEMSQHATAETIRHAPTAREAQLIAMNIQTDDRWATIKQSVMYELIQEKAKQCPTFNRDLRESKGRLLVEDTTHEYWGRGSSGKGLNMLGRLLMTLRDNLPRVTPHGSVPGLHSPNPSGYAQQRRNLPYPRRDEQQPRCFNCGEKSHNIRTCKHSSPLQCYACFGYGHKQKSCSLQVETPAADSYSR